MKKIVICFIFLGLASCNKKNVALKDKPQVKQPNEHISKKDTINGNEYIFYFKKEKPNNSKNVYCNLDSLVVLRNTKRYVINLINKNLSSPDYALTDFAFTNYDFNFDGINDIMLYPHVKERSVYNNNYIAYFYIFNEKNKKYENKAELDTIPNVTVCKKNKYLISNDGVSLRKYIWKENSLKLIETIKQTELETGNHKFHCE